MTLGTRLTLFLVICCYMVTTSATSTNLVDEYLKMITDFYEDVLVRKPRILFAKLRSTINGFLYGK